MSLERRLQIASMFGSISWMIFGTEAFTFFDTRNSPSALSAVLAAFASFFIYLIRRANRLAAEAARTDAAGLAPSEGTAQC